MRHACDGRDLACASCIAIARRGGAVRAAMTVDDALDDIKRARIWTQLEDRLADVPAPRRARWSIAIGVAAAAAVAAIAVVARAPRREAPHTLAVPIDTTVTSQLGPHTRAAIVGPAQLEFVGAAGAATSVRLRTGTLLAEFTGGPGRSLRIEAPGAVIEIVGTLFAIEVRDGRTCTSVAHGRVRVTTPAATILVGGGERYCTGDQLQPIPHDVRDALARHGAVITAEVRPAPAPAPAAVQVPAPATDPLPVPAPALDPVPAPARVPVPVPPAPAIAEASPPAAGSAPAAPRPIEPAAPRAPAPRDPALRDPALRDPTLRDPAPRDPAPPARAPAPAVTSLPAPLPATDPPPRPGPAPAARPAPTADELYRTADAALAARDLDGAERALSALLADYPDSSLADQALYDRARISYQRRAWAAARRHLERLAALPATPLAEPGHWLRCRIALDTHEPSAAGCLADYRRAFPRAPHDLDALALSAQLAHAKAGCAGAAKLVEELAQAYPRTTLAAAWRARCPEAP